MNQSSIFQVSVGKEGEGQLQDYSPLIRQESQFALLSRLQKLLKDEYLLLTIEREQKFIFQQKLQTTLFSYYRSSVNMGESTYQTLQQQKQKMQRSNSHYQKPQKGDRIYEQSKRLLEDEGFGNSSTFVKQIVLSLSQNPYIMMALIKKYQHSHNLQSFQSIVKVIVGSMYENIVDDDVFNKDILKILIFCIKNIVEDKKHYSEINLQKEGLNIMILNEIIERNDIKYYAKQIIRNTLLEVAKLDHAIQFDDQEKGSPLKPLKMANKQSIQTQESPIKMNGYMLNPADKKSKIKLYSEGFRYQDQRIRKGSVIKRKYRNCISDELLRNLGIDQQISFPCFSCGNMEEMKLQQEINRQLGLVLNRSDSNSHESVQNSDIRFLKNVVLIFFNDLFKMLYSMPAIIRISCRILYKYLSVKFNNKNSSSVVADFVINFWLASSLRVDVAMAEAAKLSPFLQRNIEQAIIIIKSIVKDNYKDVHPNFAKQYNLLVTNLKVSIAGYVYEVINIESGRINEICDEVQRNLLNKGEECSNLKRIKSFCVCLSMKDLQKIMEMIKGAEKEIAPFNDKLIKRVQRIELMEVNLEKGESLNDSTSIFGDKLDKMTKKYYRPNKAYVLFSQLSLPAHLTMDYTKHYLSFFKKSKSKNVLRQVLLSLSSIESYQQFYTANSLQDFFYSLQLDGDNDTLHSIDTIPLSIKLQYLNIFARNTKINKILVELQQQTVKRFEQFKYIWLISKQCYLKAISSINFQNERLSLKETYIRNELKRHKLEQFFIKNEIKLCLTSPKTREKQIVLKTNLMKGVLEEYREKLWLENQSRCIHTALNLDFIKSLTGEPQKTKLKYESHINSIMKFSEILCALPEVKERFNVVEDTIGIKQVFFEFIQFIRDFIKSKQLEYSMLLQNLEWLEENIELKISKRLYDKLYPKYALYDDIALYMRLKTLDWISFQYLKIEGELRNWKIWQVAANQLKLIDKLRTAGEKLHCIQQCNRIIVNSYMLLSKSQKAASADDIYPLMVLVLIKAAPKRLISSISFIESFASQSKLLSKQGYCFTQLKAAIQFCDYLTAEQIRISEDKGKNYIEFNKFIYDSEIRYGVYFMLGKRKDSPRTQKKKIQYLKDYFQKQQSGK